MKITRKQLVRLIRESIEESPFIEWIESSGRGVPRDQKAWPFNIKHDDNNEMMALGALGEDDSEQYEKLVSKWSSMSGMGAYQSYDDGVSESGHAELVDPEGFLEWFERWAAEHDETIPREFHDMVDAQIEYLDSKDIAVAPSTRASPLQTNEVPPDLVSSHHVVSDFGKDADGVYAIVVRNESQADKFYDATDRYLEPSADIYRDGQSYRSMVNHGMGPWGSVEIRLGEKLFRIHYDNGDHVDLEYDMVGGAL